MSRNELNEKEIIINSDSQNSSPQAVTFVRLYKPTSVKPRGILWKQWGDIFRTALPSLGIRVYNYHVCMEGGGGTLKPS